MEAMEKLVAILGEKLQPVRSPRCVPTKEMREKSVETSIAPLAQYMKDRTAQGQRLCVQLQTLLEEVEC
jgi:hypothetical protein